MNKNKKFYSQPEAELLVVRFEQNIMSQGAVQANGTRQGSMLNSGDYDFDEWD